MTAKMMISTDAARDGFYPTPPSIANRMLSGIDFNFIQSVLEPSAGKGELVSAAIRAYNVHRWRSNIGLDVDCCEIDPHLRQILKYEFLGEKKNELLDALAPLQHVRDMDTKQRMEKARLESEIDFLEKSRVHVVHDDFLTYRTYKPYSLILMNPPFSSGDLHLLHAIEMQSGGGSIVCLLNAETLRNPYTATRKLLSRKLEELEAKIEYIDDAFSGDAERKAQVDVAIVRIHIEHKRPESTIYQRMKAAAEQEHEIPDPEIEALVPGNYLEQAVKMYRVEVGATMELVKEYNALVPFMSKSINPDGNGGTDAILKLVVDKNDFYSGLNIGDYMRLVRLKYWRALFNNQQFTGRLTSDLVKRYRSEVDKMADYEFSMFNIKQILLDMSASMRSGVEEAIMGLFEKLTAEHSWFPECSQNIHYFNGWKTNKAHKIGKKCIIPTRGMFSSYSWDEQTFRESTAYEVISDIEKALNYLDAQPDDGGYDLRARLSVANSAGQTRNIELKYFKIDLFKKGTTHIKFLPEAMPIVERLNIYASRKKNWLPPNYGRTAYNIMAAEARAVVDSFHGDGSEGSGEKAYTKIIQQAAFYLAEPTQKLPALMAPAAD